MGRQKKGRRILNIPLSIILVALIVAAFLLPVGKAEASPATIYVPDNYSTIQAAVDAASPGDTVVVRDGTYTENVVVNKQLTLRSENGAAKGVDNPVIDGNGSTVITIVADNCSIKGFELINGGHHPGWPAAGIWVKSDNNIIEDNIIRNNRNGIKLSDANYNVIRENKIHLNDNDGVSLGDSLSIGSHNNEIVRNNIFQNGEYGIGLWRSSDNQIVRNNISRNGYHYGGMGIYLATSTNNLVYLNNFADNYKNVYVLSSGNIWNSQEEITYKYNGKTYTSYLGNYWSDYEGSDANGDGIGDTPYSIDSDKDNYPLTERFENYEIGPAPSNTTPPTNYGCLSPHIKRLQDGVNDFVEDYQAKSDKIRGYVLDNAESAAYFLKLAEKAKKDITFDFISKIFSLGLYATKPIGKLIHFKHTSLLSIMDEATLKSKYPSVFSMLNPIGGLDNIGKAYVQLTKEQLKALAEAGLRETIYALSSEEARLFSEKLNDYLKNQSQKDMQELNKLKQEALRELSSLTPEEAKLYLEEIEGLKLGNTFLVNNYLEKSNLIKTIASIKKDDEKDWKLKAAKISWKESTSLLAVSAQLATMGLVAPAIIEGIEGIREQFFENRNELSVDAQMAGLGAEALNEGFILSCTIYQNIYQALQDIKEISKPCVLKGSITVENKKLLKVVESGIAGSTPMVLGEEGISEVLMEKEDTCTNKTKYVLAVFYKKPYTSFKLFPGVERTYKDLIPVQKTTGVRNGFVRFSYHEEPPGEGSNIQFFLFGKNNNRLYGLAFSSMPWEPKTITEVEGRDYSSQFITSTIKEKEYARLSVYYDGESGKIVQKPTQITKLKSPGELRVYDSQGRVTGLVNMQIKEEIPKSIYDKGNKLVAILDATDSYHYEIVGTEEETYGLEVISVKEGEATTFTATDIPTTTGAIHDYTVDWDALSLGEEGVTVQIDSDGDGKFEKTIAADSELTSDEFEVALEEEGLPFWIWILIGVGVSFIVIFIARWRLRQKKA